MNKKQAIKECKELWKEIEKSGLGKYDFLETLAGRKWLDKYYDSDCPLCEYVGGEKHDCEKCPLLIQYGRDCFDLDFEAKPIPPSWFEAVRGLK